VIMANNLTLTNGTFAASGGLNGGYGATAANIASAAGTSGFIALLATYEESSAPTALGIINGSSAGFYVGINSGGLAIFGLSGNSSATINGTVNLADGKAHVLELVYQNTSGYLTGFVDGVVVGYVAIPNLLTASVLAAAYGVRALENGSYPSTGIVSEASIWTVLTNRIGYTPRATPFIGIEPGLAGLWHLTADGSDSTVASVSISYSDGAIFYSPYNWADTGSNKQSINAGAYFRLAFTGSVCNLTLDASVLLQPRSELWVSVDGQPMQKREIANAVDCSPQSATITAPWHTLEVFIKSTTETQTRWAENAPTAVIVTSIQIASGASYKAPSTRPNRAIFYGDSITEGVRTLGYTAANDTDRNDNLASWSASVARALNAEYGIVGFGGSGLTVTGSGAVPPTPQTFNLTVPGVARSFQASPNFIFINLGTNDESATSAAFVTAASALLQGLVQNCPSSRIIVMTPFDQEHAADWQTAVAQFPGARIAIMDTSGFLVVANGADDLNLHPTAGNCQGFIAPAVLGAAQAIIAATPAQNYVFS